jgi:hypothetical protein
MTRASTIASPLAPDVVKPTGSPLLLAGLRR